ncbi:MAG: thiamine pyrophosphate-dependent enzyme, partial [Alphaproteobacteria bacterium]
VVLALPEDMLVEATDAGDAQPYVAHRPAATAADIARVREILAGAEKPLMLVGGSCWSDEACRQAIAFAEANGIPAAVSFRRQDLLSTRSRAYAGDIGTSGPPALVARFKEADVVLVVGARLGEMTTQGYTTLDSPRTRQALVHVHPDADEIGRVFRPALGIVSSGDGFFAAARSMAPLDGTRWAAWAEAARKDYLASLEAPAYSGPFDSAKAMHALDALLPADAIITLDAGNHTGWPQRFLHFGRPRREVGPTSGAMGYSVPAAVAASLVHRDRVVVGFVGDGGFMMSGQELATAVQHGGKPIVVVFNNRMYGTIRMHQEREYPERVVGTDLSEQDFLRQAEQQVEALNAALVNIPADRLRMHVCWGNYEGPHTHDIDLVKILGVVLKAKPAAILFEASNPRHAHEWAVWQQAAKQARIPDD